MSGSDNLGANSERRGTGRLNRRREELEQLPKDELIEIMLQAEGHEGEQTLRMHKPTVTRGFDLDLPWEANDFLRLPIGAAQSGDAASQPIWRIALVSFDLSHPVIGIELYGDVYVGRGRAVDADIDLSAYDASGYGVSRRHILLRPTANELLMIDQGSTNGTHLNGALIEAGEELALADKDVIMLAGLQFQLRIIESAS